jgi:hypothetical protein
MKSEFYWWCCVYRIVCINEHKHRVLIDSTGRRTTEYKEGIEKLMIKSFSCLHT